MLENSSVSYVASSKLPTPWGEFDLLGFDDNGHEHVVLAKGLNSDGQFDAGCNPLIRIHSECLTGDALFSQRCDCGSQLQAALKLIQEDGHGAVLYLRQEGRGIGLLNKIKAYNLQDAGADTVEANEQLGFAADQREYGMCKTMFEHINVSKIRLLTNNPKKIAAVKELGIELEERIAHQFGENPHNEDYLKTKQNKLGHLMGKTDG